MSPFSDCYAVIFTSKLKEPHLGYYEMAERMEKLATMQPGFLGIDSARNDLGITVSYWKSLEDIKLWKANLEHQEAQSLGKEKWYAWYDLKICKIERHYSFGNLT
ncbi:antibiotic biosynthesis monooxygenase family protein [Aegicerativicinus sediminis]